VSGVFVERLEHQDLESAVAAVALDESAAVEECARDAPPLLERLQRTRLQNLPQHFSRRRQRRVVAGDDLAAKVGDAGAVRPDAVHHRVRNQLGRRRRRDFQIFVALSVIVVVVVLLLLLVLKVRVIVVAVASTAPPVVRGTVPRVQILPGLGLEEAARAANGVGVRQLRVDEFPVAWIPGAEELPVRCSRRRVLALLAPLGAGQDIVHGFDRVYDGRPHFGMGTCNEECIFC
jgi:hypothetical protein